MFPFIALSFHGARARAMQPMSDGTHEAQKLGVFISYSRDDLDFADHLDVALDLAGFAPTLDRHGIHGAENWEQKLLTLIRDADTVVFVLSPSSAASKICAWEVKQAVALGKRIIPVAARPLGEIAAPPELAALNYIFFYADPKKPGSGVRSGSEELIKALKLDLGWMQRHTRLLQRALEWHGGGRKSHRLLSGGDIAEAKAWIAQRPKDAPAPTELHVEFIKASEAEMDRQQSAERLRLEERERLVKTAEEALAREKEAQAARARARRIITSGSIAAVMLILAGLGVALYVEKKNAARQAELTALAEKRQAEAEAATAVADKRRREADAAKAEAQRESERAQRESKRADQFVNLVDSNPAGRRAMEVACREAIEITSVLATTIQRDVHQQARGRFWELYFGPMYIVELHQRKRSGHDVSNIEQRMVQYGDKLNSMELIGERLPQTELCSYASALRTGCIEYLNLSVAAAAPCE